MRKIRIFLSRLPFTLMTLAGLVIAALATNTAFQEISRRWLNRIGFAPNDLWYWRIGRMFTSAFVTSGGRVFWEALFFVTFAVGLAEWMTGWKRASATFWGVHLLTLVLLSLIVSLFLHQLRAFGLEAAEAARDVGPSAGYFACLGLVSAQLKRPWNLVSGALFFAMFVVSLFLPATAGESAQLKFSADLAHLMAFGADLKRFVKLSYPSKKNHEPWSMDFHLAYWDRFAGWCGMRVYPALQSAWL